MTEQLGTAHPELRKAERMRDACCRCGSESGEGKRGENGEGSQDVWESERAVMCKTLEGCWMEC